MMDRLRAEYAAAGDEPVPAEETSATLPMHR